MKRKASYAPLSGITLKQLRVYAAVIGEGSNVAAATRLNVPPPAIGQQLKMLEEAVALPLLERHDGGVRPTAAIHDGVGGRGSGGVGSTAKDFAPRAFAAFQSSHSGVELDLFVGNRAEIVSELEGYARDIVIMGRPPEDLDLVTAPIRSHPHTIITPTNHRLVGKRGLRLAALAEEKWLVRENGSGTRLLMQRTFEEAGFTPHIAMEMNSNETIKQAVMAGLGIAFLSAHTFALEQEVGQLATLDVRGLPGLREWFAVRRADKRMLPPAEQLWEYLTTRGKDFLPRLR